MRVTALNIIKSFGGLKILNNYKSKAGLTSVICFHRVNDTRDIFFPSIGTQVFAELLTYISKNFDVITLDSLYTKGGRKPKLLITFDDGYKDFIDNALPELHKLKMPSVHSVVYNCAEFGEQIWTQQYFNIFKSILESKAHKIAISTTIGNFSCFNTEAEILKLSKSIFLVLLGMPKIERELFLDDFREKFPFEDKLEEMMTWEDIVECDRNNVEIGCHTMTHDVLTTINDNENIRVELIESKLLIEKRLNKTVRTIAFPNGLSNEHVVKASIQGNYKYLLGLDDRLVSKEKDIISRLPIYHSSLVENEFKVEGFHNIVKTPYRKMKSYYANI